MTGPGPGFEFTAVLWITTGNTPWHFISLPETIADDIDARYGHEAKGFGSQKVEVTIGATTWQTSVFPDTKRGTFVLPVKKAVRVAEGLADGATTDVSLTVITA